jgi:hypothetical protein
MNYLRAENPIKKIEYIKELASTGMSNKEIAEKLGYKDVHNMYTFMRRQGFVWNGKRNLFVIKGEVIEDEVIEDTPTGKVATIISMFEKKMDGKEVAIRLKFSTFQELADYMRGKGYEWDNSKQNYKKSQTKAEPNVVDNTEKESLVNPAPVNTVPSETLGSSDQLNEFMDILKFLAVNKNKLVDLLKDSDNISIPRYDIGGLCVTKSVEIAIPLNRLIKDFSIEKKLTLREIFRVALIDFLMKYGYLEEVKKALNI